MHRTLPLIAAMQAPSRQHVAVLVLIPLVMATVNSNWLFTPIGYLDPWYNVGYFLHYGDAAFRTAHYKISRLSWLLPGWVLYLALGPMVANFVLHVGALLVATVFLYLTLSRLVARDLAFLTAVFLTIYFPFHGSAGWDYQTTGSGAFYSVTLYCLTRAGQSEVPATSLLAAGVAYAATFHASILFINMVPVLAGHFLVARRSAQLPMDLSLVLRAMGLTLAGFLAMTLVLCVINWSVGRHFLFFQPILDIVFRYVQDTDNVKAWWSPWSSWWVVRQVGHWPAGAYYLAVPLATMLVSLLFLGQTPIRAWRDSGNLPGLFLIGQYVLLGAIWTLWQCVGQTALEPDYFAYPLIIPCVVGLTGLMATGKASVHPAATRWLLPAALLLALVPGMDVFGHLLGTATLMDMSRICWVGVFFIIALLLVVAMTRAGRQPLLAVAVMAIFQVYFPPFMEAAYAYAGTGPFSTIRARYAVVDGCAVNRTAFAALIALDRFASVGGRPDHTWLWLGPQETASTPEGCAFDLGHFRFSAVSLAFNPLGSRTDTSVDQIVEQQIGGFGPHDRIALVTTDASLAVRVVARLHQLGHSTGPVQQMVVKVGHSRLWLQILAMPGRKPEGQ
jgi:hypothetical protein